MCQIGVLKKVNRSEWAAPTFIIPKKDGTVRFISDFRELNKRIKRKPFPIPKIQDLMMKLEGFTYGTSLDLNMGYYHIQLNPDSKNLCTIVLPFGKYEYQKLPMGLCNSPDIFQEKMSTLMYDLEYVRAYIDDLLIITKSSWSDHLTKLDEVLQRLKDAGLKINANKSFFGRHELEYLGYWITRHGVQPIPKKVEAIQNIKYPKTRRELRKFIGMINFYRDMWIRRSELLAPLTKLCSKNVKWQWTEEHAAAFDKVKKVISKDVLLSYPDFSKPFDIHTDASHHQLGAVISQNGHPIAFYSRKLSPAQTRYTTTERELLAIVETLKEFRNILLGQQITVYTDHMNLTYKTFNTERVMRWRLILEEYSPNIVYVKGEKNIVADALSRLEMESPSTSPSNDALWMNNADLFGNEEELPTNLYPLSFKLIAAEQQKDKDLLARAKADTTDKYHVRSFRGGGKVRTVLCLNDKILVPKSLQQRIVQWYHTTLCHPGETRTEQTIRQHFTWKGLREHVHEICSKCSICQKTKKTSKKYGHLPEKEAECHPWEKLCVDLIGPYTINNKNNGDTLTLWCVTMIDPATSWFELQSITTKDPGEISNIVEQTWLTRYPWPQELVYDKGGEFMGLFAKMITNDYGIKRRGITTRNPQANAIIERIHQTLGNIIRTFELFESDQTAQDSWNGILSAAMFALRSTYHTTLQATPMQLVFGRDAILNLQFEADWQAIKNRKQKLIQQNNNRENRSRIPHSYQVGDKVLYDKIQGTVKSKYGQNPYAGPYEILQVNNNGTVVVKMGAFREMVNIWLLKPYKD